MGLVALGEGGSRIQTNYDEGVEGNPLIIADVLVEGIPDTFISNSILMGG